MEKWAVTFLIAASCVVSVAPVRCHYGRQPDECPWRDHRRFLDTRGKRQAENLGPSPRMGGIMRGRLASALFLVVLGMMVLSPAAAQQTSPDSDYLIVPGQRAGPTTLGPGQWKDFTDRFDLLERSEVREGTINVLWKTRGDRLTTLGTVLTEGCVHTPPPPCEVLQIIVNDSDYATAEGLHVGVTQQKVQDTLGLPSRLLTMNPHTRVLVYASGIMFATNDKSGEFTVVGIVILPPKDVDKVVATLLPAVAQQSSPENYLIVPGKRMGPAILGDRVTKVIDVLGPPDVYDVAPGVQDFGWVLEKPAPGTPPESLHYFDVNATATRVEKIVRVIIAGDPRYATADGLHVGSTDQEVQDKLGVPTKTSTGATSRSLVYASGIIFIVREQNDSSFRVSKIIVISPRCLEPSPPRDLCTVVID